jgi:hypothetical protein
MKNTFLVIVAAVIFVSCATTSQFESNYSINEFDVTYVKPNMEFLASEDLQGRNTATLSERAAGQFIVSELKKYGVEPFGDDGTYFQTIDFTVAKFNPESYAKIFDEHGDEVVSMKLGEDFMSSASSSYDTSLMDRDMSVTFVGYGITAPEYNYNDYENIDVSNNLVIALTGEPYSESDEYFDGTKSTMYSNPFRKLSMAEAAGASGILVIPDEQYLQYWSWLKRRSSRESISLSVNENDSSIPSGLISIESVRAIFQNQSTTYSDIESMVSNNETPEPFKLNLTGRFELQKDVQVKPGRNVVGILPGSNSSLADEFITVGAHYDHVGVNSEGEVYNGADDNASGTVSVMEVARLLSQKKNNKRPIVFILYTGEEKGLLGSKYFVENFPNKNNIVTNINIDMTGRESLDSIHVIGSDRISDQFHEMIKEANSQSVNYYLDYSLSNTRLFRQSDHYTFAKENIPVVFFFDNMRSDLHRTTDDVEKINFTKIAKTAHLVSKLALDVANLDERLALNEKEEN